MHIVEATQLHASRYADEVAELVHATGPASYDHQFLRRELFDSMIKASWRAPHTLFGYDEATLALDGDELLGIMIAFQGPEFLRRRKAMAKLWEPAIAAGEVRQDEASEIARRSYVCSYLNVAIPSQVFYIHALAVKETQRGRGVGAKLLQHAVDQGKQAGLRGLHLDVLSDTAAVNFYRAKGLACLAETVSPEALEHGVPMEMRMALDFNA